MADGLKVARTPRPKCARYGTLPKMKYRTVPTLFCYLLFTRVRPRQVFLHTLPAQNSAEVTPGQSHLFAIYKLERAIDVIYFFMFVDFSLQNSQPQFAQIQTKCKNTVDILGNDMFP